MSAGGPSALHRLAEATQRDFPNLFEARARTTQGLVDRRHALESLEHSSEASVVLMGSWGRSEVTSESDDDFMVLVQGAAGRPVAPSVDEVADVLDRPPGRQGIFAAPVFSERLVRDIGLDRDDNTNMTRRMLFLLESVPVTGDEVYGDVRAQVLDQYLDESVKDHRPPRFLLNDTVRYWRTMCVDFAAKEREGPDGWGLRNAKLRTSRKILFAGGLLPILDCHRFDVDAMRGFLREQLEMPPTDRIAAAFLQHGVADSGARTLGAYDEFVGHLNDPEFRRELRDITRETLAQSTAFSEAQRLGRELQAGFLALLYEAKSPLPRVAREYVVF